MRAVSERKFECAASRCRWLRATYLFPKFVDYQSLYEFDVRSRRRARAFDEHDVGFRQLEILEAKFFKAASSYIAVNDELRQDSDAEPRLSGFGAALKRADLQGCGRLRQPALAAQLVEHFGVAIVAYADNETRRLELSH